MQESRIWFSAVGSAVSLVALPVPTYAAPTTLSCIASRDTDSVREDFKFTFDDALKKADVTRTIRGGIRVYSNASWPEVVEYVADYEPTPSMAVFTIVRKNLRTQAIEVGQRYEVNRKTLVLSGRNGFDKFAHRITGKCTVAKLKLSPNRF